MFFRAPPLIGRVRELTVLMDALQASVQGSGAVVVLGGEPGIGKTRLAAEVAPRAQRLGAQVLWGAGLDGGAPAYWLWIHILRAALREADPALLAHDLGDGAPWIAQLVPSLRQQIAELPPLPADDADSARFHLFDACCSFFQRLSERRPLVLILDDLHWADTSSLLLLGSLGRIVTTARILVVATYRTTDIGTGHPLPGVLTDLARSGASVHLSLHGLPPPELGQFLTLAIGRAVEERLASAIAQRSEGNPFFAGEMARLLAVDDSPERPHAPRLPGGPDTDIPLPLPLTVHETIRRRLDRLPSAGIELLTSAALVGREFAFETLTALVNQADDDVLSLLDAALDAHILEEAGPGSVYRFSHALIQEVLLAGLSSARRMRLQGRVATTLQQLHGDRAAAHAAELARHFGAAAPLGAEYVERAAHYHLLAAEQAERLAAWDEAVRQYAGWLSLDDAGLLTAETIDHASLDRAGVLTAAGRCARHAGDYRTAWHHLLEAIQLYRVQGDGVGLARATLEALAVYGPPQRLLEMGQAALDLLDGRDPSLEARLHVALIGGYIGLVRSVVDLDWSRTRIRALVAAHGLAEVGLEAAYAELEHAWNRSDHGRVLQLTEGRDLVRGLLAAGRIREAITARSLAADSLAQRVSVAVGLAETEAALAMARRYRIRFIEENTAGRLLALYLLRADFSAFDALATEQAAAATYAVHLLRAMRAAMAGALEQAVELLPEPSAARAVRGWQVSVLAVRCRVLWLAGHEEQARREFTQLHALLASTSGEQAVVDAWMGAVKGLGESLPLLASAAQLAQAAHAVHAVEAAGRATTIAANTAESSLRLRAMVRLWCGDADRAARQLEDALAWCEREHCPIEAARCLEALADIAQLCGGARRADELRARAQALFVEHGAQLYLRRRASGAVDSHHRAVAAGKTAVDHRPARPATPIAQLNARQLAYLRLLARGHTNREIAEVLVVSDSAVEQMLVRLYDRIGARNRADAIRYVLEHGLLDDPPQ